MATKSTTDPVTARDNSFEKFLLISVPIIVGLIIVVCVCLLVFVCLWRKYAKSLSRKYTINHRPLIDQTERNSATGETFQNESYNPNAEKTEANHVFGTTVDGVDEIDNQYNRALAITPPPSLSTSLDGGKPDGYDSNADNDHALYTKVQKAKKGIRCPENDYKPDGGQPSCYTVDKGFAPYTSVQKEGKDKIRPENDYKSALPLKKEKELSNRNSATQTDSKMFDVYAKVQKNNVVDDSGDLPKTADGLGQTPNVEDRSLIMVGLDTHIANETSVIYATVQKEKRLNENRREEQRENFNDTQPPHTEDQLPNIDGYVKDYCPVTTFEKKQIVKLYGVYLPKPDYDGFDEISTHL